MVIALPRGPAPTVHYTQASMQDITGSRSSQGSPPVSPTTRASPSLSASDLRRLGEQLNNRERHLNDLQDKIATVKAAIEKRKAEGRPDFATYRQAELVRLQNNYDQQLQEYQNLRENTIGESNVKAALQAAPKEYNVQRLAERKYNPGGESGIKYSQPNSVTGGGTTTPTGTKTGGRLGPQFRSGQGLAPGVYVGGHGEQVIVQQGQGASTAGGLIKNLQGQPYTPAPLPTRQGKIVGVVEGEYLNLGPNKLQITDERTKTTTTINLLPLTAINGRANSKNTSLPLLASDSSLPNLGRSQVHQEIPQNTFSIDPTAGFVKRIQATQQREENFQNFIQFIKLPLIASYGSGGFGKPLEQRGIIGRTIEKTELNLLTIPFSLAVLPINIGEKISAIGEGIYNPVLRPQVIPELTRAAKVTPVQVYTEPSTYTTALVLGAMSFAGAKTNPVNRAVLPRVYPNKFTTVQESGISFVEDVTVHTPLRELRSLEGRQEVPGIHVTTFNFGEETILKSQPAAGEFRQANQLFQFYKSSPEITSAGLQPRAYLAYAGIVKAESTAPSSGKIIFGNPTINLLSFNEPVARTPVSIARGTIREINFYQGQQSGKTFVPAENLGFKSTEGQLIVPTKYETTTSKYFGFVKETNTIPGYESFPGSKLTLSLQQGKYLYYKQDLPDLFGVVPRSRYFKLQIIPAKTSPVDAVATGKSLSEGLNVQEYAASYGRTRTFSPSPLVLGIVSGQPLSSRVTTSSESRFQLQIVPSSKSTSTSSLRISSVSESNSPSLSPSPSLSSSGSSSPSRSRFRSSLSSSISPSLSPSPSPSSSVSSSPSPSLSPSPSRSASPSISPFNLPRRQPLSPLVSPKRTQESVRRGFDVFVRKHGKFGLVGTNLSKEEAVRRGRGIVQESLAASFKVTSGGRALSVGELGLGLGKSFRTAKKNPTVFVQRRSFRLSSVSERSQIQTAKRRKRRGNKGLL